MRLFFATATAFSTAPTTSFALPTPKPTRPFLSPIATAAEKLSCLHPRVTFVTLRISRSSSLNSFSCFFIRPHLPPLRGGRVSLLGFVSAVGFVS